jgi:hypothetical protein
MVDGGWWMVDGGWWMVDGRERSVSGGRRVKERRYMIAVRMKPQ